MMIGGYEELKILIGQHWSELNIQKRGRAEGIAGKPQMRKQSWQPQVCS